MWPQHMQSDCVTQVCICHSMHDSLVVERVAAFMSALQRLCASHFCALSINIQQKQDGATEITVHTLLLNALVYVSTVKHGLQSEDCTVNVGVVPPQALGNTSVVMQQLRNLRVNHGH